MKFSLASRRLPDSSLERTLSSAVMRDLERSWSMKRVPLALIVALITECFGPSSSAASSIDTELIAIEQRWNDAFLRKDAGVLSEVLADDFVIVYGNGDRGNKQSEISGLTSSDETIESS